jgi:hypothetical protein
VKISTNDIEKIGNATYTFKYSNIKFVKNYGSKVWFYNLCCRDDNSFGHNNLNVDIVCRFRKNSYGYYIEIEDTHSTIDKLMF